MKVLSLFSGVGGFDLGLERAGMETVFQCEWDKHATKILEKHWPHVPRWGDVSTLTGQHILAHAPVIDVVAWGSPCQDLSVAGKRAGLQGARSGLFHEGVRIIKELRELTDGKYPRISIWENVAGALSSGGGADFGQVLYEMDEAGACFSEWRILDAQYFGVPQPRRRVFLVSIFDSATAARCPDPLLPVSQSVRRDTETSGTQRQEPAGTTPESIAGRGHRMRGFGDYTDDNTASAIKARDWKDATDLVTQPFTVTGFAKYEPGIGTLRSHGGDLAGGSETLLVEPLTAIVIRECEGKAGGGKGPLYADDKSHSLIASNDQKLFVDAVAYDEYNDRLGGQVHHALRAGTKQSTGVAISEVVGTLRSGGDGGVSSSRGEHLVVNDAAGFKAGQSSQAGIGFEEGISQTINANMSGLEPTVLTPTMAVRRLTPIECERLMGWPDDWTAGQADTHRYKQCGNGVASPVATWIAHHLQQLDDATDASTTDIDCA